MIIREAREILASIAIAVVVWFAIRSHQWLILVASITVICIAVSMWKNSRIVAVMLIANMAIILGAHWVAPRWPVAPKIAPILASIAFLLAFLPRLRRGPHA